MEWFLRDMAKWLLLNATIFTRSCHCHRRCLHFPKMHESRSERISGLLLLIHSQKIGTPEYLHWKSMLFYATDELVCGFILLKKFSDFKFSDQWMHWRKTIFFKEKKKTTVMTIRRRSKCAMMWHTHSSKNTTFFSIELNWALLLRCIWLFLADAMESHSWVCRMIGF